MRDKAFHNRLYVMVLVWGGFVLLLVGKFAYIQIINGDYYQKKAKQQHERFIRLEPARGIIYDRNLEPLTLNLQVNSYGLDCAKTDENKKRKVASTLAAITHKNFNDLYQRIRGASTFRWLDRKVSQTYTTVIDSLRIPGLYRCAATLRSYPFGPLACHVVGFTNIDNEGMEGVELSCNGKLKGIDGETILQIDARGFLQPDFKSPLKRPTDGYNIVLTIDAVYQKIVEEELARAVEEHKAKGGMVILLKPSTGEVLGLANQPNYDPNNFGKSFQNSRRNRAITDVFEPGSTFKLVPLVAALEEKLVNPLDKIYCEGGEMKVGPTVVHDAHKFEWLTVEEVIAHSSNIGAMKIGRLVGERKLYQYARSLGFGIPTGVNLPGEVSGVLRNPSQWSALSLSMISFGQEVSTTALQVANAYAAMANEGVLLRPYIIRKIVNDNGEVIKEFYPKVVRRVVSPATAQLANHILSLAVKNGTAMNANIDGISIAGKTGTAQKSSPGKGYADDQYVSLFVGYLPVEAPQLVCLVAIDEPQGVHFASEVAVPAFRSIIERIINSPHSDMKHFLFQNVSVPLPARPRMVEVPELKCLSVDRALDRINDTRLAAEVLGDGKQIAGQYPPAGTLVPAGASVKIITRAAVHPGSLVPDLTGMPLRKAITILCTAAIPFKIEGTGMVVKQDPLPGTILTEQQLCIVGCEPSI